uniref:Uncharacterized protein n=1 Tax=Anguilla anguilla TaxID=7936 RepID=A0A0E9V1M2_ANGAN
MTVAVLKHHEPDLKTQINLVLD